MAVRVDLFPDYDEISLIAKLIALLLYVACMLGATIAIRRFSDMKLPETIMILLAAGLLLGLFFMFAIISIPFDFMLK